MRLILVAASVPVISVSSAVSAMAQPAPAVQTAPAGTTVYGADFYRHSGAVTALDLIQRTPGFSLVEADPDVRGYAGSLGNILVDGMRPTSKTEKTSDLLARIPAQGVERIELIRTGSTGVDLAGFIIVANVVRRATAAGEGAVVLGATAASDWSEGWGRIEYSHKSDDRLLEISAGREAELDDDSGTGVIRTRGADGSSLALAQNSRVIQHKDDVGLSWRRTALGGDVTLSSSVRRDMKRDDSRYADVSREAPDQILTETEDDRQAEAALRYERDIGHSRLGMLLSHRMGWLDAQEDESEGDAAERFTEQTDTAETILRAEVSHKASDRLTLTTSLEGTRNILTSDASLEENGDLTSLPGSSVRVEERRAEAAAGAVWRLAGGLSLQAALRVEASQIVQEGDARLERTLFYPKPRLSMQWNTGQADRFTVTASREVGQLDFGDFVASASLDRGTVSAGAGDLRPDRTWRLFASWEHGFWNDGALTLSWTHDWIEDAIDRVVVLANGEIFDAPGNIGSGRRDTLAMDIQAPLDRFGIAGGRLRGSLAWRTSQVTDPTTGEHRPISEEKPVEGEIAFTQDLAAGRLQWGLELDHIAEREIEYRFDEITRSSEGLGWTVFVERRIGRAWRVRAEATDPFGRTFRERREIHDGPRSTSPLDEIETRRRDSPGYVSVSLRRSMGG